MRAPRLLVLKPPTPLKLVDFPPELITAVCDALECHTIATCRAVCRRLRDVIDASLELQYRIELVRDGMVDGTTSASSSAQSTPQAPTPSQLTIADRLARLRNLRSAWQTLRWTRCVTIPVPGPCCAYELVGGIFCKTQPRVRARREVGHGLGGFLALGPGLGAGGGGGGAAGHGDGFGWDDWIGGVQWDDGHAAEHAAVEAHPETAYEYGSRVMSTTWLPGPDVADRPHTVIRDDLGIPTRDFAIDPSQDLLVLFKGGEEAGLPAMTVIPGMLELYVRTISTNQTHPEARAPVLSTPVLYPVTSVFVQIVDDIVGMMYCIDPSRPRITIWNWKTGKLVVDRNSGNLPAGTWDFSFINSRALLVTTSNDGGSLELFTFTCDRADGQADPDAEFEALTPTSEQPTGNLTSPLIHVASLHFPPIHRTVRILSIGTHTGPHLAGCPPGKPFAAANGDRIHVLTVQYMHLPTLDGPRVRPRMCLFVKNRTLEAFLDKGMYAGAGVDFGASEGASESTTNKVLTVPWTEWGRAHTRILLHVGPFQWLRYVHGQRVVILQPMADAGKSTLQVLDFNVRRAFHEDDGDHRDESANEHEVEDTDASGEKTTLRYVDDPSDIVMPTVFVNTVQTGLPYREAKRDVPGEYSGMMIDDERLVGLRYPAFLTGDMKEIDVFTM